MNLNAKKEDDLVFAGWSDAALAPTGGYMIGMCRASMLDGVWGAVSLISWSESVGQASALRPKRWRQEVMFIRSVEFLQAGQLWNLARDEKFVSAKKKKQALLRGEAEEDGAELRDRSWQELVSR